MRKLILSMMESYLSYFARIIYGRFRPYVIGVTGSTGKTTTKYMIYKLGKALNKNIFTTTENLNTEIGLPLAILGFKSSPKNPIGYLPVLLQAPIKAFFTKKYPKYLVLEYGVDKPGDMKKLTNLVSPDAAVITNIGVAHLSYFKKVENIEREKWQLALASKDFVFCHDKVSHLQNNFGTPKAEVYTPESLKISNQKVQYLTNKTEFELKIGSKTFDAQMGFAGKHNLENLDLAISVVFKVFGTNDQIGEAVKKLMPLSGRGERFIGKRDILVIDESYNANPASMAAALNNLDPVKLGRKVVIIGEMKEIDPIQKISHEKVAELARQKADFVIGVGEGYKNLNLDKWYANVEQLEQELDSLLQDGDVLLVKGSYAVNLKKIVDKIK